eukprot:scaffold196402_cov48-Prasinocladus_malaysianus.AAC.1
MSTGMHADPRLPKPARLFRLAPLRTVQNQTLRGFVFSVTKLCVSKASVLTAREDAVANTATGYLIKKGDATV